MVQTLDDMLADRQGTTEKLGVWLRIGKEMPLNIVEEYISNWEGADMEKSTNKRRIIIGGSIALLLVVGLGIGYAVTRSNQFTPTTLANVQKSDSGVACLQTKDNSALSVASQNSNFIGNAVATSIIDVPAGTNVDVYFKSFDNTNATGTAIYAGKYGTYNFTAIKTQTGPSYTGGWTITHFAACKV